MNLEPDSYVQKESAGELRTQIYIGMEIGYVTRQSGRKWLSECEEASKMLHGLIHSVRIRAKWRMKSAGGKVEKLCARFELDL